jgi:hypothetical protein
MGLSWQVTELKKRNISNVTSKTTGLCIRQEDKTCLPVCWSMLAFAMFPRWVSTGRQTYYGTRMLLSP